MLAPQQKGTLGLDPDPSRSSANWLVWRLRTVCELVKKSTHCRDRDGRLLLD